eukprot:CAMPEP_0174236688 /NCGR_PEP_ID=MMETSP0417-20130205/5742_1 /TAXON_ID=242541 /ORGANISM="Mayorella sp, Strain BSH-02190019" /LENGTH=45 /DNA_ID= /DNA_START= /DNA_END= /DNA_ORIENTATION=
MHLARRSMMHHTIQRKRRHLPAAEPQQRAHDSEEEWQSEACLCEK